MAARSYLLPGTHNNIRSSCCHLLYAVQKLYNIRFETLLLFFADGNVRPKTYTPASSAEVEFDSCQIRIFILASVAESVGTRVRKIQPLVDEL